MDNIPLQPTQSRSTMDNRSFNSSQPLNDRDVSDNPFTHELHESGGSGSTGNVTPAQPQSRAGGRRVQWFLDGADQTRQERHDDRQAEHTSVQISPESRPGSDYFGNYAESSGSMTPVSGAMTPDISRPPSPSRELDMDIMEGEKDGLPEMKPSKRLQKQANRLIAAHKAKNALMMGASERGEQRRARSSSQSRGGVDPMALAEALRKQGLQEDAERPASAAQTAASTSRRNASSGGILGSLMRLYERPTSPSADSSEVTLVQPEEATQNRTFRPFMPTNKSFDSIANSMKKGTKQVAKTAAWLPEEASKKFEDADRPWAARNAGGVFGALQASALDLAGVASPIASTIKPAPEKSGFRLNRHAISAESSPPKSRDHSAPSTPGGTAKPSFMDRHKPASLSLTNLQDLLDPAKLHPSKLHSESHALKANKSRPTTPDEKTQMQHAHASNAKHRKRKNKKQDEIFITMHIAAILQRQDFILRLARAHMMFGGPSHRFEAELQGTGKILDIDVQVVYLMSFCIISFADPDTQTSSIKIIKQNAGLNLYKLKALAVLHWEVMRDKIGVEDASAEVSRLMVEKPVYNAWLSIFFGGMCSIFIGIASFNASFIDLCAAAPLGAGLIAIQVFVASKSDVLSSVFEIFVTAIASFAAAGLSASGYFCYASIISSTIVLILPGWLVCNAALELQSRAIVTGSVRLIWSIIYALFLGFGISIGAQIWNGIAPQRLQYINVDSTCSYAHMRTDGDTPWWQVGISEWFYFLAVPGFPFFLALKNQAKIKTKEFWVTVVIAGIGWTANHFAGRAFPQQASVSSTLGALAVGVCGNLWGKFFQGTGFIVALVPIMFQLPSGLGSGGLLNFAANSDNSEAAFSGTFAIAQQLVTVGLGLVVGLFAATVLIYPIGSNRAKGLMSF